MKNKFIQILFIFIIINHFISAQESHGGIPLTFNNHDVLMQKARAIINNNELPVLDNEFEKNNAEIIEESMGFQKNKFYGKGIDINLDFKKVATVQQMGDSGKLYLYQITSPSAYALQIYFDGFKLPPGARMFLYNKEKSMFLGSFTSENNFVNNTFGSTFITGNSAIIEYYEPNEVVFESTIHISKISHVFVNYGPFSRENKYVTSGWGSSPCNINASCELGYGWERERKSIAIILGEYTYEDVQRINPPSYYFGFCTGALVNNTAKNGEPYFLTANHCTDPTYPFDPNPQFSNTANWIFLFNHETVNCTDLGSSFPGSIMSQAIYGATILNQDGYGSPTSDYLLLKLNVWPETLKQYGVVYAGWDIDDYHASNSSFTVGIHHPNGDVRKISRANSSPVSATYENDNNDYWQVNWSPNLGITEGGSSGSPLFNSSHKIIGQLRGGTSSCDTPYRPDYYGKFSTSYYNGFFHLWLDPLYTGATEIGPYNPSNKGEHCYNNQLDGNEVLMDCGGDCPPCNWVLTTGWASNPEFHDGKKNNSETGIDCGGDNKPCGGIEQCSNRILDGDEEDVDCGGSCIPCNSYCKRDNILYQNTGNLPKYSAASNSIIAGENVTVQSGQKIFFKAQNKISLKAGFSAKSGSSFNTKIAPCICKTQEMSSISYPIIFYPEHENYCCNVVGYDKFEIQVFNSSGHSLFYNSGPIYDENPCLWDGTGAWRTFAYLVIIKFYNDCLGTTKTIQDWVNVFWPSSSVVAKNQLIDGIEKTENIKLINIYPNPTDDKVTIENLNKEFYSLQVFDFSGKLVETIQDCFGSTVVNMKNYMNGMYTFKILGTNLNVQKVIKK